MTPARLRDLLALAEARKARDLARLEALIAADRTLAHQALDLAGTHARDMAEGAGSTPLALLGHRLIWADGRLTALRAARARLGTEIADVRAAATISLGKHRALEHLLERALRTTRAQHEARAERDAPPAARGQAGERS